MSTSCNGILNEKMNINHNTTHYVSTCKWVIYYEFLTTCSAIFQLFHVGLYYILVLGNVVCRENQKCTTSHKRCISHTIYTTQCLRVKLTNFICGGCCLNTRKIYYQKSRLELSCLVEKLFLVLQYVICWCSSSFIFNVNLFLLQVDF